MGTRQDQGRQDGWFQRGTEHRQVCGADHILATHTLHTQEGWGQRETRRHKTRTPGSETQESLLMKTKKKKKIKAEPIFVSPDGGETVYQQLPDGNRVLVEQSQKAQDEEQVYEEAEMVGTEAIELRRKYPTLKKAWDRYRVIWRLVSDND